MASRGATRIRWDRVGRVCLLAVFAVVIGLYIQHALGYFSARNQAADQAAVVRRLARDNARLATEQQSLNDPATIELEARQLGMVRPGERPYAITGLPKH
jgi:cell division protein FtsB